MFNFYSIFDFFEFSPRIDEVDEDRLYPGSVLYCESGEFMTIRCGMVWSYNKGI